MVTMKNVYNEAYLRQFEREFDAVIKQAQDVIDEGIIDIMKEASWIIEEIIAEQSNEKRWK